MLAVSSFLILLFVASQFYDADVNYLLKLYKIAVLFTAGGVFLQFISHYFLGLELFRYQLFGGGRNAYSFIWEDYSFLSLYLISAIPLFFDKKISLKFLIFSSVLFVSSIITSARSGVAALFLFLIIYILYDFFKSLRSGRARFGSILVFLLILALPYFVILGMEFFTGREVTSSSSGRMDDFVFGYKKFLDNPVFGYLFNKELYHNTVSKILHNVFIYTLYMGGLVSFFVFLF